VKLGVAGEGGEVNTPKYDQPTSTFEGGAIEEGRGPAVERGPMGGAGFNFGRAGGRGGRSREGGSGGRREASTSPKHAISPLELLRKLQVQDPNQEEGEEAQGAPARAPSPALPGSAPHRGLLALQLLQEKLRKQAEPSSLKLSGGKPKGAEGVAGGGTRGGFGGGPRAPEFSAYSRLAFMISNTSRRMDHVKCEEVLEEFKASGFKCSENMFQDLLRMYVGEGRGEEGGGEEGSRREEEGGGREKVGKQRRSKE
jgi:hypothetical protein